MRIGISLPNNWGVDNVLEVVRIAVLAEELGFDSVWVADHLLNVGYLHERIAARPYYHPLAILAYAGARTSHVSLGTSVLVLPFRHPVELAKFAATLDHLSDGRLILGVGAGGLEAEFDALGIPWHERGALSDESLEVIRELWTQALPSHSGARWRFSQVAFAPKPLRQPHPPLWIGGAGAAARRRVARLGDGWHPTGISIEEFRAGCIQIRRAASEAGRDPSRIQMSMRVNVSMPGTRLTTDTENRAVLPGDDLERLARGVDEWRQAGCEHLVLAINSSDIAGLRRALIAIAPVLDRSSLKP